MPPIRSNNHKPFSDLTMPGITPHSTRIQHSVGKIVFQINTETLELLEEYKKSKSGKPLSARGGELQKAVKSKQEALEEALKSLVSSDNSGKLEKTIKMLKNNIETAKKILDDEYDGKSVEEKTIQDAQIEAKKVMEEAENDTKSEEEISTIASKLEGMFVGEEKDGTETSEKEIVQEELDRVGEYQADRVKKMAKLIEKKMSLHKQDLLKKWEDQKDLLDYQSLKEFRTEFESSHKYLRNMVNEWDRRRISDKLYDYLMDIIDQQFDNYMKEFKEMDDAKRTEAALIRKRNIELDEYKKEKKKSNPFMA